MCLAVYMGCNQELQSIPVPDRGLGCEPASWRPLPLKQFSHVYYFGQINGDGPLNCSCLLTGHVERMEDLGVKIEVDETYPETGPCPFGTLRAYVEQAVAKGGEVMLHCDDGGGGEQPGTLGDYENHVVEVDMIRRESHLFVDPVNSFPWRVFTVVTR